MASSGEKMPYEGAASTAPHLSKDGAEVTNLHLGLSLIRARISLKLLQRLDEKQLSQLDLMLHQTNPTSSQ